MNKKDYKLLRLGIWWTLCTGSVMALVAGRGSLPHPSIILIAFVGASALLAAVGDHGWLKAPSPLGAPFRIGLFVVSSFSAFALVARFAWPSYPQYKADGPSVSVPNISAPYGIAIGGGTVVNPTVNNIGAPHRHLSAEQKNALAQIAARFPQKSSMSITIYCVNDGEARQFAQEIFDAFSTNRGVVNGPINDLEWTSRYRTGTSLITYSENRKGAAIATEIAAQIANAKLFNNDDRTVGTGEIRIVVGTP